MTQEELKYNLALSMLKGVGCVTAKNLVAHFGSAQAVFEASPNDFSEISLPAAVRNSLFSDRKELFGNVQKEMEFIEKKAILPIAFNEEKYPFRLKECADAPLLFYVKGSENIFGALRFLSIVGTRRISEYGKKMCRNFLEELSAKYPDVVIVSGLAYGVDVCAHKEALNFGLRTVAVLAHGLDMIYPALHRDVAARMCAEGGALISEYPSGTIPDKGNFVQRNRIVAGLSDATLVVESAEKGGALITADLALSYNRDVLAFPGRATDEYSKGCNKLIKTNKAAMVETVADLEYVLGWESNKKFEKEDFSADLFAQLSLTDDEKKIFEMLKKSDGIHINQLSLELHLPMSKISPILIGMEFKGIVKCLPGNMYRAI